MLNKKQIVFVEPKPTVYVYRLARSLRLTGRYETILISFSEIDKKFFGKAYDKILILELSHKLKFKNFGDLFKRILSKNGRNFFKNLKKMRPYLFQITGPDFFSLMVLHLLRNNPSTKIYYSNDLWSADQRNFFFTKEFWIKGEIQKFCEKRCFGKVDGILDKKSLKEFELTNYKLNIPKMALPPSCLDEWTFYPKKKKDKKIHIVLGGAPYSTWKGKIPFMEILNSIISQEIYFHTYGECANKKDNESFVEKSKNNKYYCFHKKTNPYNLNKEMSEYTYGILLDFHTPKNLNSNPSILKTQLTARMVNYLEAGLPIIINKQYEHMTNIIKEYGIGFYIELQDLKNLRKIIERQDYAQLQNNVKKFQQKFKLSKTIKEIEDFYEKIIRAKSEKNKLI